VLSPEITVHEAINRVRGSKFQSWMVTEEGSTPIRFKIF
jgi:hypothetical protein